MLTYQIIHQAITNVGAEYKGKTSTNTSQQELYRKIAKIADIFVEEMEKESMINGKLPVSCSLDGLVKELDTPRNTVIRYLQTFKTAVDMYLLANYQIPKGTLVIEFEGYTLRGSAANR